MSEQTGPKPAETFVSVPKVYAQAAYVNSTSRETIIVFSIGNPFISYDDDVTDATPVAAIFLHHDHFAEFTRQCNDHLQELERWKIKEKP